MRAWPAPPRPPMPNPSRNPSRSACSTTWPATSPIRAAPARWRRAGMAIEEMGGTVLGKPVKAIGGDHQNKPDIAASVRAPLVRHRGRAADRRHAQFRYRAGGAGSRAHPQEDQHHQHGGLACADRQELRADVLPLDVGHLFEFVRPGEGADQEEARHLVLHHGRLRLRPRARGGFPQGHRPDGRQDAGLGQASGRNAGLQLADPGGAGLEGARRRGGERRQRHRQHAQVRQRVRAAEGRNQLRRTGDVPDRREEHGLGYRAGADLHHRLHLELRRYQPRLRAEVLRTSQGHADDGAGGRLFRRAPLSARRRRPPNPGCDQGRRQDARDAGQRCRDPQRHDPGRTAGWCTTCTWSRSAARASRATVGPREGAGNARRK